MAVYAVQADWVAGLEIGCEVDFGGRADGDTRFVGELVGPGCDGEEFGVGTQELGEGGVVDEEGFLGREGLGVEKVLAGTLEVDGYGWDVEGGGCAGGMLWFVDVAAELGGHLGRSR